MSDHDENVDQNFNDAELQDIMNEIESLEKEFIEQEASEEPAAQTETDIVQASTSEESEMTSSDSVEATTEESPEASFDESESEETSMDRDTEFSDEDFDESPAMEEGTVEAEADNVVSMESRRSTTHTAPTGEMSFSGHGQMDFNMNFQLGSQEASLSVQDGKLVVSVAGVELALSEEGCDVEMAGGVRFSVPLDGQSKSSSKKAA